MSRPRSAQLSHAGPRDDLIVLSGAGPWRDCVIVRSLGEDLAGLSVEHRSV
jgi:hypothetical protein